jgi:hypothetical protein
MSFTFNIQYSELRVHELFIYFQCMYTRFFSNQPTNQPTTQPTNQPKFLEPLHYAFNELRIYARSPQ